MTAAHAAMFVDAPLGLFLVWIASTLALVVVGIIWIVRPALAAVPLKRLGVAWLILTVAVGLVSWRVFGQNRPGAVEERAFVEAPNFSFRTVDGKSYSRNSLHGKVVLIEFWASWCGPCRESLPEMFRLYRHFKNPRFVMIGVNEDQNQSKFEAFVAQEGIRWPQDWDPNGKVATRFSTDALPSYAVIDADGRLRFMQKGYDSLTYLHIREAISDALGSGSRLADAGSADSLPVR